MNIFQRCYCFKKILSKASPKPNYFDHNHALSLLCGKLSFLLILLIINNFSWIIPFRALSFYIASHKQLWPNWFCDQVSGEWDLSLQISFVKITVVIVQSISHIQVFVTPWTAAHQAYLSFTNSQNLLKLISIKSVMPCNHLVLCHPLLLLPSIFPSIRVLSKESALCIRRPKY